MDAKRLRDAFIKYLTVDGETQDARRKEFNQRLFNPKEGWQCWDRIDFNMIMEKFDKSVKEVEGK